MGDNASTPAEILVFKTFYRSGVGVGRESEQSNILQLVVKMLPKQEFLPSARRGPQFTIFAYKTMCLTAPGLSHLTCI